MFVAVAILAARCTEAFVPSACRLTSNSLESSQVAPNVMDVAVRKRETKLDMFMGSDGGILGVGTPELVRIIVTQEISTLFADTFMFLDTNHLDAHLPY